MKIKFEKYGIRTRILILFTALVIIPFFILIIVVFSVFQQYARKSYGESMVDTLTAVTTQVMASMEKYEESTMSFYYNGGVEKLSGPISETDKKAIEDNLSAICYSYNGIMSSYLVSEGRVYHSYQSYSNLLDEMEQYQNKIIEDGGSCSWYPTSKLFGRANTNHYVMARSLNSSTKKNVGILYLVVNDKMIADALNQLNMEDSVKYLVDKNGMILYSSDTSKFGKKFDTKQLVQESISGYHIGKIGGQETLIASYHLFEADWYFISTIREMDMMKLISPLKRSCVYISIVYLLFLFIMLLTLQKYVFRPLGVLKSSMDQFALGNLNIQMPDIAIGELSSLSKHFNNMTFKIKNLMVKNENEVREKNNFKMQSLVAQLTPHFIYNSLNTIRWIAVINKQDNIQKLTDSLIQILMNAAKVDDLNYTIADELELIKSYAVIQKARFMNFDLEIEADESVLYYKIHKFLIQPIVENSIIHGLGRGSSIHGKIKIRIWADEELKIIVEDNGVGMNVEEWSENNIKTKNHTNIGLKNIEQIITLEYGEKYSIQVNSKIGQGTLVEYTLPIIIGEKI
ncbi:MAG: hypothetical protein E7247_14065 [Paenibacillaceae bacterium]|nr:hypothetical protein [Paenibacillaceae bacterium]